MNIPLPGEVAGSAMNYPPPFLYPPPHPPPPPSLPPAMHPTMHYPYMYGIPPVGVPMAPVMGVNQPAMPTSTVLDSTGETENVETLYSMSKTAAEVKLAKETVAPKVTVLGKEQAKKRLLAFSATRCVLPAKTKLKAASAFNVDDEEKKEQRKKGKKKEEKEVLAIEEIKREEEKIKKTLSQRYLANVPSGRSSSRRSRDDGSRSSRHQSSYERSHREHRSGYRREHGDDRDRRRGGERSRRKDRVYEQDTSRRDEHSRSSVKHVHDEWRLGDTKWEQDEFRQKLDKCRDQADSKLGEYKGEQRCDRGRREEDRWQAEDHKIDTKHSYGEGSHKELLHKQPEEKSVQDEVRRKQDDDRRLQDRHKQSEYIRDEQDGKYVQELDGQKEVQDKDKLERVHWEAKHRREEERVLDEDSHTYGKLQHKQAEGTPGDVNRKSEECMHYEVTHKLGGQELDEIKESQYELEQRVRDKKEPRQHDVRHKRHDLDNSEVKRKRSEHPSEESKEAQGDFKPKRSRQSPDKVQSTQVVVDDAMHMQDTSMQEDVMKDSLKDDKSMLEEKEVQDGQVLMQDKREEDVNLDFPCNWSDWKVFPGVQRWKADLKRYYEEEATSSLDGEEDDGLGHVTDSSSQIFSEDLPIAVCSGEGQTVTVRSIYKREKEYPVSLVRYTKSKPELIFSKNRGTYFKSRAEVFDTECEEVVDLMIQVTKTKVVDTGSSHTRGMWYVDKLDTFFNSSEKCNQSMLADESELDKCLSSQEQENIEGALNHGSTRWDVQQGKILDIAAKRANAAGHKELADGLAEMQRTRSLATAYEEFMKAVSIGQKSGAESAGTPTIDMSPNHEKQTDGGEVSKAAGINRRNSSSSSEATTDTDASSSEDSSSASEKEKKKKRRRKKRDRVRSRKSKERKRKRQKAKKRKKKARRRVSKRKKYSSSSSESSSKADLWGKMKQLSSDSDVSSSDKNYDNSCDETSAPKSTYAGKGNGRETTTLGTCSKKAVSSLDVVKCESMKSSNEKVPVSVVEISQPSRTSDLQCGVEVEPEKGNASPSENPFQFSPSQQKLVDVQDDTHETVALNIQKAGFGTVEIADLQERGAAKNVVRPGDVVSELQAGHLEDTDADEMTCKAGLPSLTSEISHYLHASLSLVESSPTKLTTKPLELKLTARTKLQQIELPGFEAGETGPETPKPTELSPDLEETPREDNAVACIGDSKPILNEAVEEEQACIEHEAVASSKQSIPEEKEDTDQCKNSLSPRGELSPSLPSGEKEMSLSLSCTTTQSHEKAPEHEGESQTKQKVIFENEQLNPVVQDKKVESAKKNVRRSCSPSKHSWRRSRSRSPNRSCSPRRSPSLSPQHHHHRDESSASQKRGGRESGHSRERDRAPSRTKDRHSDKGHHWRGDGSHRLRDGKRLRYQSPSRHKSWSQSPDRHSRALYDRHRWYSEGGRQEEWRNLKWKYTKDEEAANSKTSETAGHQYGTWHQAPGTLDKVSPTGSPLGLKLSVADSTISDAELAAGKRGSLKSRQGITGYASGTETQAATEENEDIDKFQFSPRDMSLDERIALELGIAPSPPTSNVYPQGMPPTYPNQATWTESYHHSYPAPPPCHPPKHLDPKTSNYYSGQESERQYEHVDDSSHLQRRQWDEREPTLDYTENWDSPEAFVGNQWYQSSSTSSVVQVGNMLQVVPADIPVVPPADGQALDCKPSDTTQAWKETSSTGQGVQFGNSLQPGNSCSILQSSPISPVMKPSPMAPPPAPLTSAVIQAHPTPPITTPPPPITSDMNVRLSTSTWCVTSAPAPVPMPATTPYSPLPVSPVPPVSHAAIKLSPAASFSPGPGVESVALVSRGCAVAQALPSPTSFPLKMSSPTPTATVPGSGLPLTPPFSPATVLQSRIPTSSDSTAGHLKPMKGSSSIPVPMPPPVSPMLPSTSRLLSQAEPVPMATGQLETSSLSPCIGMVPPPPPPPPPPPLTSVGQVSNHTITLKPRVIAKKKVRRRLPEKKFKVKDTLQGPQTKIVQVEAIAGEAAQEASGESSFQGDIDPEEMKLIQEAISEVPYSEDEIPEASAKPTTTKTTKVKRMVKRKKKTDAVPLPPPGRGILISAGFREKPLFDNAEKRKSVTFADGIKPGEGTSPSGGEDMPSPPPPDPVSDPPHGMRQKKKVKVKVIRNVGRMRYDDDDDDDDESPPPPPPGSPPAHLRQHQPFNYANAAVGYAFPRRRYGPASMASPTSTTVRPQQPSPITPGISSVRQTLSVMYSQSVTVAGNMPSRTRAPAIGSLSQMAGDMASRTRVPAIGSLSQMAGDMASRSRIPTNCSLSQMGGNMVPRPRVPTNCSLSQMGGDMVPRPRVPTNCNMSQLGGNMAHRPRVPASCNLSYMGGNMAPSSRFPASCNLSPIAGNMGSRLRVPASCNLSPIAGDVGSRLRVPASLNLSPMGNDMGLRLRVPANCHLSQIGGCDMASRPRVPANCSLSQMGGNIGPRPRVTANCSLSQMGGDMGPRPRVPVNSSMTHFLGSMASRPRDPSNCISTQLGADMAPRTGMAAANCSLTQMGGNMAPRPGMAAANCSLTQMGGDMAPRPGVTAANYRSTHRRNIPAPQTPNVPHPSRPLGLLPHPSQPPVPSAPRIPARSFNPRPPPKM